MHILHTVEFYEPTKGGAEEVIRQISERLVQRGHNVTVATSFHPERKTQFINSVEIREFKIRGNMVKGITGDKDEYRSFLKFSNFDIILNYAAQTWTTDLMLPLIPDLRGKKVIAPLGYSKIHKRQYRTYFKELPYYLTQYDKIIYTSENYRDKLFGDLHGVNDKAVIVPNGADSVEFQKPQMGFRKRYNITTRYMFLSVSNHYFAKGHIFLFDAIRRMPRDDFTLVIIGEKPQAHGWYSCYPLCRAMSLFDKRVKVLSSVPREWVISAYREADLFLFGSRVECAPLVMYESFASRLPFFTKDAGNVKDHKDYLQIVEQPRELAEQISIFFENPLPYRTRANYAYEMFCLNHTWDRITDVYKNLYSTLLAE